MSFSLPDVSLPDLPDGDDEAELTDEDELSPVSSLGVLRLVSASFAALDVILELCCCAVGTPPEKAPFPRSARNVMIAAAPSVEAAAAILLRLRARS